MASASLQVTLVLAVIGIATALLCCRLSWTAHYYSAKARRQRQEVKRVTEPYLWDTCRDPSRWRKEQPVPWKPPAGAQVNTTQSKC